MARRKSDAAPEAPQTPETPEAPAATAPEQPVDAFGDPGGEQAPAPEPEAETEAAPEPTPEDTEARQEAARIQTENERAEKLAELRTEESALSGQLAELDAIPTRQAEITKERTAAITQREKFLREIDKHIGNLQQELLFLERQLARSAPRRKQLEESLAQVRESIAALGG